MKRAHLIINPTSGTWMRRVDIDMIRGKLARRGISLTVFETRGPEDATAEARRVVAEETDLVIAAGGDGTINEVVNGLAGSGVPLAILPQGTENVLAQEFSIPLDLSDAADLLVRGQVVSIDLGLAHDRHFLLTVGIGLDAQIVSEVDPLLKKIFGSAAYPLTAIQTVVTFEPSEMEIRIDDEDRPRSGYFVIVGNSRNYAAGFKVTPLAKLDDGKLDVCIFKKRGIADLLRYVVATAQLKQADLEDVESVQAERIQIRSSGKLPVHADCEIIGTTPVNIRCVPGALKLVVPPPNFKRPGFDLRTEIHELIQKNPLSNLWDWSW
ncbi:MAG: diacylglycerol kinase family lipid kinase [Candidatus Eisenbacteria sp.]|nr:diacylglycerol kinase family lipid kinase [Candidatus Eisenbacteria bacterium]